MSNNLPPAPFAPMPPPYAPSAPPSAPLTMPEWHANSVAQALEVLVAQSSIPGQHYLPAGWVRAVAERGLKLHGEKPRITPAMYAADKLLEAAITHEQDLTSRFRERVLVGLDAEPSDYAHENPLAAELVELRALLEPLRPPPPATAEELAAKLAWALGALETYAKTGPFTPEMNKARAVLARAPK